MKITPLKAIRAKCLDCSCESPLEVRECPVTDCPLYMFRFGHNPNISLTEEQRARKGEIAKKNIAGYHEKLRKTSK